MMSAMYESPFWYDFEQRGGEAMGEELRLEVSGKLLESRPSRGAASSWGDLNGGEPWGNDI